VSSVGASFGTALGRDGAVNKVLGQGEDKGKALDRELSLRSLDHKSSLTALGRKEQDAKRREMDVRRNERERKAAGHKPVWKGLRDKCRGWWAFGPER